MAIKLYFCLTLLGVIEDHSNRDRRSINSSKSTVLSYTSQQQQSNSPTLYINDSAIPPAVAATHLGILQSPSRDVNDTRMDERISMGTRTLYALFGAGLHGRNGLNPSSSRKIWTVYILPRILHGSELWLLQEKHIQRLELFQRQKLRQLQGLPDRTSSDAVLGIIGVWPIEAEIDRRILVMFRNIANTPDSIEYKIALRQLGTKDTSSKSWFIRVVHTLQKYDLPTAYTILDNPPSRHSWKSTVIRKMCQFWNDSILTSASNKSSLRFVSAKTLELGHPAILWSSALVSHRDTQKAFLKAKLLTGTYRLQAHEAVFNKSYKNMQSTCHLCKTETEDRNHFLLRCRALDQVRHTHLPLLASCLTEINVTWESLDDDVKLHILLDANHIPTAFASTSMCKKLNIWDRVEKIARDCIYSLHVLRWKLLSSS